MELNVAIHAPQVRSSPWVLSVWWMFAATLFTSAALLFLLEPMFAKMVLPYLGGSPAVWNTCVLFFQSTMLAGSVYAHSLSRHLPLRRQVAVHVLLLGIVSMTLPVIIPASWTPPVDHSPVPALLALLLMTAGPSFFVVSATAPLVQHWFAKTNHHAARDPYVLYSASNLGSVTALLAYPLIVERSWTISVQGMIWKGGYGAFAVGILLCGITAVRLQRTRDAAAAAPIDQEVNGASPSWRRKLRWLLLSLVPSSLMLAVTTFLSTDIAAVPLLWVIPLTLYLLSFVNAFSRKPPIGIGVANNAMKIAILPLTLALIVGANRPTGLLMALHILTFFACALVLHGQLARDRPDARHLTSFYLWISVGGVLGGAFNTLIAPVVFTSIAEYPLMLVAACGLGVVIDMRHEWGYRDLLVPVLGGGLFSLLIIGGTRGALGTYVMALGVGVFGALYLACAKYPVRLATMVALMFMAGVLWGPSRADVLLAQRTFFGVLRVRMDSSGMYRQLVHGTTLHGEEAVDPARSGEPLMYYHRAGPIGQVFEALSPRISHAAIGVVGLGIGSLAAYSQPDQRWTFYELDPAVERIARSPLYFRYLSECGARCAVTLGDARLSLARTPRQYDLLIVDAFSSDAIPVHLLTREALQLYLRSLKPDGILAFHITNRNLDLKPVLGALAKDASLACLVRLDQQTDLASGRSRTEWLVMARGQSTLDDLRADARWHPVPSEGAVWTDDYSNIVTVLANRSLD